MNHIEGDNEREQIEWLARKLLKLKKSYMKKFFRETRPETFVIYMTQMNFCNFLNLFVTFENEEDAHKLILNAIETSREVSRTMPKKKE